MATKSLDANLASWIAIRRPSGAWRHHRLSNRYFT